MFFPLSNYGRLSLAMPVIPFAKELSLSRAQVSMVRYFWGLCAFKSVEDSVHK